MLVLPMVAVVVVLVMPGGEDGVMVPVAVALPMSGAAAGPMAVGAAALPMLIIPGAMVGETGEALLTGAAAVVLLIVGSLLTFHSQH